MSSGAASSPLLIKALADARISHIASCANSSDSSALIVFTDVPFDKILSAALLSMPS